MSDDLRPLLAEPLAGLSAYTVRPDPAPVKLDANESPWPLPPAARRTLAEAVAAIDWHRYPDLSARRVRQALALHLDASAAELLVGVGSDEVIGMLLMALRRPRDGSDAPVLLIPSPTFVMYALTARVHGWRVVEAPLGADFHLDVDAFVAAMAEHRPNLVFLASPNNPTGGALPTEAIDRIVEAAAPDCVVILDEAYAAFAGSSLAAYRRHAHVGLLGTLSKLGLAGLRLGWARLDPWLRAEVEKARPPFNLNAPSQVIAELALSTLAPVLDQQVMRIREERERLGGALTARADVTVIPSEANFILVDLHRDAAPVHRALLERGVQVRFFAKDPRLSQHLRVTVGTPAEDDAFLAALDGVLAG